MRTRLFVLVVAGGLLAAVAAAPALAHHAFAAEFDGNKPIKLSGVVTKMEWINPHAWIHMDVKNPDGTVRSWMIEGAAPNALIRRGWNRDSLLPGTEITITGFLAKDGSNKANGRDIFLSDGRRLFAGSSGIGAPETHPDDR
jgi:hypothetical protein